jgi:hypothetical protein
MKPIISELLVKARRENLYIKIIQQLNKDFLLANVPYRFSEDLIPEALINKLFNAIMALMTKNYDSYLNFIYRVDLSEKELAKISDKSLEYVIKNITFLILKREYQKVWFKNTI